MKKLILYTFILSIFTLIMSCKSKVGQISEVQKAVVFPGVPQANTHIEYTAKIEVLKPVQILSVQIASDNDLLDIKEYSLIKLKEGMIMNTNENIPAGNYFFKTSLPFDEALKESSDKLIIKLKEPESEKVLTYKIKVVAGPSKMRR